MDVIEERVTFASGRQTLSGVLSYPAGCEPERAVLLCTPHPHFAGDMANNVIAALGRFLAERAVVLRFDYRGVGDSSIVLPAGASVFDYWHEVEEAKDYDDAIGDVRAAASELYSVAGGLPLSVVGYSFGAATGLRFGVDDPRVESLAGISPPLARVGFDFLTGCVKPCLLLCGKDDFVCAENDLNGLVDRCGPNVRAEVLAGQDHFFRGCEQAICTRVSEFVRGAGQDTAMRKGTADAAG